MSACKLIVLYDICRLQTAYMSKKPLCVLIISTFCPQFGLFTINFIFFARALGMLKYLQWRDDEIETAVRANGLKS